MKILLDTHYFLWALVSPDRLSKEQRQHLVSGANTIYVSSISITEIGIKAAIGKFNMSSDPVDAIGLCGFEKLDYTCEEAALLRDLPMHHRDPFDRMLIAQSLHRRIPIMTDDKKFAQYDCKLI